MAKGRLLILIKKYLKGTISPEERSRLLDWYRAVSAREKEWISDIPNEEEMIKQEILLNIRKSIKNGASKSTPLWRYAAAASVALFAGIGMYFLAQKKYPFRQIAIHQKSRQDHVSPHENKTFLTLANGEKIALANAGDGVIAQQGATVIHKLGNGQIIYGVADAAASKDSAGDIQNTVSTGRGGEYSIVLSDGTKAWLNSASSLSYPVAFTGKERRVSIRGEVYFDVAKDAGHPFIVSTEHSRIRVLGTHFNVMAYDDEPSEKTTLVEGSVQVTAKEEGAKPVTIAPNQQAGIDIRSHEINVSEVNASHIAGWVQGCLYVENSSIQEFTNQLSRWYDISVIYQGAVPKVEIGGMLNRNTSLPDMISALNAAGIHSKIDGGKLIILAQ